MHSTEAVAVSLEASPALGRSRAAVHKQPFSVMDTQVGAGQGSVYATNTAREWEENGVSKAVRVFIGTGNTAWMQRHQRWWVRTAEKLDKTSTGRRRLRRGLHASGSSGDLLAAVAGGREKTESTGAVEWSESGDSLSDSGSSSEGSDDEEAGDGRGGSAGAGGLVTPQSSSIGVGGLQARRTVAMPVLADSPPREQQGTLLTPVTAPAMVDGKDQRRSLDFKRVSGEGARRRSSLSTIRAFFHRNDRKAASGGESSEAVANRSRAASLSGPVTNAAPATPTATPTAKASPLSPTTPRRKTSLLRRTVAWRKAEAGTDDSDAVLLAGSAAVRLETASGEALATAYTEATCRALRRGAHEWAEMWVELTAHSVRFYAASRKRPAAHVLLSTARLSVFSALDVSLALAYGTHDMRKVRIAVFKLRTAAEGSMWHARLHELMGGAPARGVTVGVPELGVKVHVALAGGEDAWAVRAATTAALLADAVVGRRAAAWMAEERMGDARVAVAWRLGDRLAWLVPSGGIDGQGMWRVRPGDTCVAGPPLGDAHNLEMRMLPHYPDAVDALDEPPGVDGFVLLRRSDAPLRAFRPVLLASHDGLLFVISAPRAARHANAAQGDACERPYHPLADACARQMCQARFMLQLAAVCEITPSASRLRLATRAGAWVELWAENAACADAWATRLGELREYWTRRAAEDSALHGRAWGAGLAWHACVLLGCRAVVHCGMLYRKRRRHQGLRRVFCVLTRGHLIEFDYPHAAAAAAEKGEPEAGDARLLFRRARTLALQHCYVVSRRLDDLSSEDIMREPWVMTDIGNYSGLRLADRLYADGVVSHDFIDDCVFTVWRPRMRPVHQHEARREASESPRSSAESCASEHSAHVEATAVAVAASLRRRVGVYRARSAAEMELWVAAVGQEIRRMVEADAW